MENENTSPIKNPSNFFKNIKIDSSKLKFILGAVALLFLLVMTLIPDRPRISEPPSTFTVKEGSTSPVDVEIGQNNDKINIDDLPQQILSSNLLLLTQDGTLSYSNPMSKTETKLLEGVETFDASNDKKKIIYLKKCPQGEDVSTCDKNTYIYDMETKEGKIIETGLDTPRNVSFAPDDRYIIVETGTGGPGTNNIFPSDGGESTCQFYSFSDPIWLSNLEALIMYFDKSVAPRLGEIMEGVGVGKINIQTCKTEALIKPTDLDEYRAIEMQGTDLIVMKTSVENANDWVMPGIMSKIKDTYEKYNIQTGELQPYPEYKTQLDNKISKMESLFKDTKNFSRVSIGDKDVVSGWEMVNVQKKGNMYNRDVYIVGPDGTSIFIGKNVIAKWF
jgi:hypothetical protein